jgi:hypothetical protein
MKETRGVVGVHRERSAEGLQKEYCPHHTPIFSPSEFLATDPEVRVRFPPLPDFLRSSGSGTGSTQPREYNWGATWKKNGSGLENQDYGSRDPSRWPRDIPYPQKLAVTSQTSRGRSVGIVRSRIEATEFFFIIQPLVVRLRLRPK